MQIVVAFTAAGSVSDYADGSAASKSVKEGLAAAAGVETSAVKLTVTAGSVNIEAAIAVASASAATAATSAVSDAMRDPAAATALLGIMVESPPVVTTRVAVVDRSPPPASFGVAMIMGAIAGGVALIVAVAIVLKLSRGRRRSGGGEAGEGGAGGGACKVESACWQSSRAAAEGAPVRCVHAVYA